MGYGFPEDFLYNTLDNANQKNVFIAISCNKKSSEVITKEHAKKIIKQAARFTNGHLGIFIADEIMKYNEIAANKSPRKALEIAMKYGDHFFDIFTEAVNQMPPSIYNRISILRYADVANEQHQQNVKKIKLIYKENHELRINTDKAAIQLLEWRCADFEPNQKRVSAILDFIYRELPIVGAWENIKVNGVNYHGMIYPAINPRGMRVIANVVSEFDKWLGEPPRLLLIMNTTEEWSQLTELSTGT